MHAYSNRWKMTHQIQSRQRYARSVMKARLDDLWGRLSGHSKTLMNFEQVVECAQAHQAVERGIHVVSLDKIVGSVGRSHDFTSKFLPRPWVNEERWSRIDAALNSMEILPPVNLYKVGELYFVLDGNHRVSVAHVNGIAEIEAAVTELLIGHPCSLLEM